MPTRQELDSLIKQTKWVWDADDKGYYVYNSADDGTIKSDALLFFPAAGGRCGELDAHKNTNIKFGTNGYYWTSTSKDGYSSASCFGFAKKNQTQ